MKKFFYIFLTALFGGAIFFGFVLKVEAARPLITYEALPSATEGESYSYQLKAKGGKEPYTWDTPAPKECSRFLPHAALSLDEKYGLSLSKDGLISAEVIVIPKKKGIVFPIKHKFYVGLKDAKEECAVPIEFTIEIHLAEEVPPTTVVQIASRSPLQPGAVKGELYQYQFEASGGSPPGKYKWFFGPIKLPSEFNPSLSEDGELTLIPTKTGNYSFDVRVQNKDNVIQKDEGAFVLPVSSDKPLQLLSSSLSEGKVNTEYKETISISGGTTPYDPKVVEKPDWLTYHIETGIKDKISLEGMPSNLGTFSLKIEVSDSSLPPQTIQEIFSIKIKEGPPPGDPSSSVDPAEKKGIIEIKNPITATSFEAIVGNGIDFVFKIAIVLSPLMVVIGGFLLLTAGGNISQVGRAKSLLLWTAIGFLVVLLSKGILAIINQILGVGGGQ